MRVWKTILLLSCTTMNIVQSNAFALPFPAALFLGVWPMSCSRVESKNTLVVSPDEQNGWEVL